MPEPAAPFAVDPGTAARALVPAEVAAATFLFADGALAYPGS